MKATTSRRSFLAKSAIISTGLALIPSEILTASNSACPYQGYNPYAEFSTDIRKHLFGKQLTISGILFDKFKQPISNAEIELWHLSPTLKKFRHRTKLKTNELGEYVVKTDFPARAEAQTARVYFRIQKGDSVQYTELAVDETGANITSKHWEENQHLNKDLFPHSRPIWNGLHINFNLSIY